jgi:hypothetical protein
MTDILLVTAALRINNLKYIAKNIKDVFANENDIRPVWLICYDQYNSNVTSEDIDYLKQYCKENNIEEHTFMEGKPNQENYGGELMNGPLHYMKDNFYQNSNPFVLVLDDDNILTKNLLMFIKKYCLTNEWTWWLNMLDEFGAQRFSRSIDRLAYIKGTGINEGHNIIHRCATCDPSQLLIRLDTLLVLGGFAANRYYDFAFMSHFYNNSYGIDKRTGYQGNISNVPNDTFYISCYHNGLVTPEMIKETLNDLPSQEYDDSYIRVHVGKHNYNIQLDKEQLEILLKYCKKQLEEKYKEI